MVKWLVFPLGIALLLYSGFRAYYLSFTIDESQTFNVFVPLSFMEIISYQKEVSANNHILNTLLMKVVSSVFGSSEFVLRMPNFLAHILYILFSFLIAMKFRNAVFVICSFILLNSNPYLLDFFSLARGYGLAVAFMLGSIYYLLEYLETSSHKKLSLVYIFAALSVLSNFSLLVFYLSVIIITFLIILSKEKFVIVFTNLLKKNLAGIIITLILAIILYEPIRKLIKFNALYSGGEIGFWNDTVISIIQTSLYGMPYSSYFIPITCYFIAFVVITSIVLISSRIIKNKALEIDLFTISFLLLLLPAIISIAQHYLIGSKFLINRMALFFIPLFSLQMLALLFYSISKIKKKIIMFLFTILTSALFALHSINSSNFSYFLSWKFDSQTKEMLTDLHEIVQQKKQEKINLGINWLYEATINYYRASKKMYWLNEVNNKGLDPMGYDYYYVMNEDSAFNKKYNKKVLKKYFLSKSTLSE